MEIALGNLVRRPVQVLDFDGASPAMRHQILRTGRLVVENDPRRRIERETEALTLYLDFLPMERFLTEAALRRL